MGIDVVLLWSSVGVEVCRSEEVGLVVCISLRNSFLDRAFLTAKKA